MKKILLFHGALVLIAVFLVWYIAYPGYIWYLEGNSFFCTIPDFADIQFSLPGEWAAYGGAYLLQFFYFRVGGALIQAFFVVIVLLTSDSIIYCLSRNKGLMWLSFIPVVWFISGQFEDNTLVRSMWWAAVSIFLALLVFGLTFKRKKQAWGLRRFYSAPFFTYIVPLLLLGGSLYSQATKKEYRVLEENGCLDRLAEGRKWDALLQVIPAEETRGNAAKLRWALLALSEKGLLPDRMFAYGVTDPACFFYERQDYPFCRDFNSQFFTALGFNNEVLHNAFQSGIQAPYGMSFRTMRVMTDTWLRLGNKQMAAKYLEVFRHTSCHGNWIKWRAEHLARIEQSNDSIGEPDQRSFFIGAHPFLSDMARIVDRYPKNRKASDYLLCGLLISKDLTNFYAIFNRLRNERLSELPKHYEEAILILASKYPELLQKYPVSRQRFDEFKEFQALLNGRERSLLEVKFRDSFWFYYYCTENQQR